MAKVIGRDKSVVKRITCRHRAEIVKYTPNEVRNFWSDKDYSGGSDGADGFNCPACGGEIYTRRW